MKINFLALVSSAVMLAPLSLFAAQNSKKVNFPDTVTVNGTTVPAGTYRVEWDGTGAVTAKIEKGKKVVATAPATALEKNTGYDGALEIEGKVLQGIAFQNTELQFQQGSSTPAGK
jgi:hypothetical protein